MATRKIDPTDAGCIVLVTPFGNGRSRRLIIPAEVGEWLLEELQTALAELKAEAKARRKAAKRERAR
jgi:hypothetical protein